MQSNERRVAALERGYDPGMLVLLKHDDESTEDMCARLGITLDPDRFTVIITTWTCHEK